MVKPRLFIAASSLPPWHIGVRPTRKINMTEVLRTVFVALKPAQNHRLGKFRQMAGSSVLDLGQRD
jgi:hypothetical protein